MSEAGRKFRPYFVAGKIVRLLTYVAVAAVAFGLGRVFDSVAVNWSWTPSNPKPDIIVLDDARSPATPKAITDRIVGDQEVTGESDVAADGPLVAPNKVDALKRENLLETLANEKQSVGGDK